jgi:hypothetical protein
LHIYDSKHKDELVKNEVPKLVLDVLLFRHSEFPKHKSLDELPQQDETAVCHVDESLHTTKHHLFYSL